MKLTITASFLFIVSVFSSTTAFAGDVDNTITDPASTSSYTLEDVWNHLNSGSTGTSGIFVEPSVIPSTGTGKTINEIMDIAPASDNRNGATPVDVNSGSKFWGLQDSAWGLQIGTFTVTTYVPQTGQTTSYETGDNGNLQTGVAWPNPRFTDNRNGTVTDTLTGLIWLKNANCFGSRNWTTALNDCNTLSSGSCSLSDGSRAGDWRLPNVEELQSLAHYEFYHPAVPNTAGTGQWTIGDPFDNVQSTFYWSSTTYAGNTPYAWYMHMGYGDVYFDPKAYTYFVWPVRGGQ